MKKIIYERLLKRWHYFVVMFALWLLYNYQFDAYTIVFGIIISCLMTWFTSFVVYDQTGFKSHMIRPLKLVIYALVLFKEIFFSAWQYIGMILNRNYTILVFDVTLSIEDPIKIALIANSITLTPGTVSVDVNGPVITVLAVVKKGTNVEDVSQPIHDKFERLLKA
jgi:multicomponent Na+:H+ antiporter subunit E